LSGDIEALPDAGKVIIGLGAARLMLRLRGIQGSHLMLQSKYLKARASELEAIQISAEQGRVAGNNSDPTLRSGLGEKDFEAYQRAVAAGGKAAKAA
jgi:hypothetical protein